MRLVIVIALLIKTSTATAQFERITSPKYISSDSLLVMINNASIYPSLETVPSYYVSLKHNVNDSVKRGLLTLLKKNRLTDSEVSSNVRTGFKKSFEYICFDKIRDSATFLSKTIYYKRFSEIAISRKYDTTFKTFSREYFRIFDSVYTFLYDSSSFSFKRDYESKLKRITLKIPDEIILSNAVAHVNESIPILAKFLSDSNYDTKVIELALAILGDSIHQQKIFNRHRQYLSKSNSSQIELEKDIHDLLLINTQQSISLLSEWLDTSRRFKTRLSSNEEESEFYSASKVVIALLKFLKDKKSQENFLKIQANWIHPKSDHYFFEEVSVEQILYMRQWMLENKGKYHLD